MWSGSQHIDAEFAQCIGDRYQWQADDGGEITVDNTLDQQRPDAVDRISAGFVERLPRCDVPIDFVVGVIPHADVGGHDSTHYVSGRCVDYAIAGVHFVRAATQQLQRLFGPLGRAGLSQHATSVFDEGVGRYDDTIGAGERQCCLRFTGGQQHRQRVRVLRSSHVFLVGRADDRKRHTDLFEQVLTTRRCGCEDDGLHDI